MKKVIIIAGPNGAGKTTFARPLLAEIDQPCRFINADLIAAELNPAMPESMAMQAGRLMLQELVECFRKGESFALETTLSGLAYRNHIRTWQRENYFVILYFLALPSVEFAISRVAERVKQGGHDIPEAVIRRRFNAGLSNFEIFYRRVVNHWTKFDNSGKEPIFLESGTNP